MSVTTKKFKHVSYLWDETKAASMAGDEVALLIYRSNLLGADLRLTNYGGGNTSCKAAAKDPLTGNETEIMWVKGSGGDLGTLKRSGLAALYVNRSKSPSAAVCNPPELPLTGLVVCRMPRVPKL